MSSTDKATEEELNLLLIGPLPIAGDHLGGAKAAFRQMVEDISVQAGVNFDVINLSRALRNAGRVKRLLLNALKFMATLYRIVQTGARYQVWAINVSPAGSQALLPCVRLISAVYRKPVVVRMFGGNLDEYIDSLNPLMRTLYVSTLSSADVLAVETKHLVASLHHLGNVVQLPNTRNTLVAPIQRQRCHHYVFLSQVRREKGVDEILAAASSLPMGVSVDVFGSLMEPELEKQMLLMKNVNYRGELQPAEVTSTLLKYDALLLPSYWEGEGHPGVIIEAFQCGLPVIATRWRQIPEVVSPHKDGILVPVKDSAQLALAMRQLVEDHSLYQALCQGAVEAGDSFRSTRWHSEFVSWCRSAVKKQDRST